MHKEEIAQILNKYDKEEILLEQLLTDKKYNTELAEASFRRNDEVKISGDEAANRNKELIKELELVKGRLRSKAIFSPTELHWADICRNYQKSPALPVTTWKCDL